MQRLDHILEQWATLYKPLSHNPDKSAKHQTFYRIDAISEQNAFMRNFNTAPSPAMAYCTIVDAGLNEQNPKLVDYYHVVYFMVKQRTTLNATAVTDNEESAELKFDLSDMVQDLLAFLLSLRSACLSGSKHVVLATAEETVSEPLLFPVTPEVREAIAGLDPATVKWSTIPMKYGNWWFVGLEFTCTAQRKLCIAGTKYI